MAHLPVSFSSIAIAVGVFIAVYIFNAQRKGRLPPGPRRAPIIGNAHQLPTARAWLGLAKMSKLYGDLMHVDVFGQSMLVVSSRKVAIDLLDKRSANYSDRPIIPMIELTGMREAFSLQPYGDTWRNQRRMVAQHFSTSYVAKYHALQERESRILVKKILAKPETIEDEVKLRTAIIIVRSTYGYYPQDLEDPMIAIPVQGMKNFNKASQPAEFLINILPSMKHLPRWLPGTSFFKAADEFEALYRKVVDDPYNWCRENLETGKALLPNICHDIWQKNPGNPSVYDHSQMRSAASSVLGAGLDSGMSSALTFFMNMILHPEVQRKAQLELDAVVGTDRLPQIIDRPNLPYVRSIVAETFRFMPAIPLALPHAVTEDDIYQGYHIPKGAWILPNVWQMLHDPAEYEDPMNFNPERFNNDDEAMEYAKDPAFGFGRRVCPGRLFAENSLFAIVSTTLATCKILPGLDAEGKEVLPSGQYTNGTIIFPEHFNIRLTPRSSAAAELLAEVIEIVE
ncbi:putative monooxygenase [Crepidotus variabilis]|uniref:Monooxygenase n=1 Tax=Crepidotus variabilis TaxID=179855 RepID=A0A9P6ETM9_9AGAR|nr:putative monooxygenase [Crepidotus variabilis]